MKEFYSPSRVEKRQKPSGAGGVSQQVDAASAAGRGCNASAMPPTLAPFVGPVSARGNNLEPRGWKTRWGQVFMVLRASLDAGPGRRMVVQGSNLSCSIRPGSDLDHFDWRFGNIS